MQLLPLTAHRVIRRVHWIQVLQQIEVIIPLAVLLCRSRKPSTWETRALIRRDLLTFLQCWRRVEGLVQLASFDALQLQRGVLGLVLPQLQWCFARSRGRTKPRIIRVWL